MTRSIFLVMAMTTLMVSCNTNFKKTKSGIVYKVFHKGKSSDPLVANNDILKFHMTEKWNDSLLGSSYDKMPRYFQYSSAVTAQYSPIEVFPFMRKGDSAIVVLSVDSLIKNGVAQMQFPYAKKGDKITLTYKILDVFHNDSTAQADINIEQAKFEPQRKKEMEEQQRKMEAERNTKKIEEAKEIEAYLASNNIKATKTEKGNYISVLDAGSGMQADSGKWVKFDYTGKSFAGTVFDSSIDTTFHHQAIEYTVGSGMIQGIDDAVRHLKKGAHAILYIPAVNGYGPNPLSEKVGPWSNLIFDVYVRDVQNSAPKQKPPMMQGKRDSSHVK